MAAPIYGQTCHPIPPLVKPCSSTALRLYPSAYPSRLCSLILINQFNCGGVIFFLWCPASHGVSYSRQSPWYLQAPPSRSAPHTASRSYPEDYICHDNVNLQVLAMPARTCRLPGFYFWFYSGGIYLVIYKTGNSIFLWWIYLFSYERTIILSSLSWHSWIWTIGLFVLSWTLWLCKFYPARIFSA